MRFKVFLALASSVLFVSVSALAAKPTRGGGGPGVSALGTASVQFGMTATVSASAHDSECQNNPGPYISLEGNITLGGLDAQLRFTNNLRGTHEHFEDIFTTVQLVSPAPITFNKQPSRGGVGGNPHIWLQLQDCSSGTATTDYVYLGRCVQGLSIVQLDTIVEALAGLFVQTGSCMNHPGSEITLTGEMSLGGICAQLVFTNNEAFTHVHVEDVTVEIPLIPAGQKITFSKAPPEGGAGGNPYIFLQFYTGDGIAIGDEIFLGRCNQLD